MIGNVPSDYHPLTTNRFLILIIDLRCLDSVWTLIVVSVIILELLHVCWLFILVLVFRVLRLNEIAADYWVCCHYCLLTINVLTSFRRIKESTLCLWRIVCEG